MSIEHVVPFEFNVISNEELILPLVSKILLEFKKFFLKSHADN